MKKLLSLLLALTLALSLAAPALAWEDMDPPLWQQYGYNSLEEYLQAWDETEEEYAAEVAREIEYNAYAAGYEDWKASYLAGHPDFTAETLAADVPPMWQSWGYSDEAAFVAEVCDVGQSYADWLVEYRLYDIFWEAWYLRQNQKALLAQREAMGGPAEGVAVMWNGSFIQFPDAVPRIVSGRTMIPVRALMESTGAQVGYGAGTVTLDLEDGRSIRFVIGEQTAVLKEADGAEQTIEMDVASFVEGGRTFVPLRFFTEALDYSVSWDSNYQTALIADPAELDRNFTVINSYMNREEQPIGPQSADLKMDGDLTVFDTLNGDKTGKLSLELKGIIDGAKADLKGQWDIGALTELLLSALGAAGTEEDQDALKSIAGSDLEIIMDLETGAYYLRSSALSSVSQGMIPEDAWVSMDLNALTGGMGYGGLGTLLDNPRELTMGKLICAMSLTEDAGILGWQLLDMFTAVYTATLGDSRFTETAEGHAYRLTDEDLAQALADLGGQTGDMPDMVLEMELRRDGSSAGTMEMTLPGANGLPQARVNMDFAGSDTAMELNCKVHVKNICELSLSMTEDVAGTEETSRSAPGAEDTVVDYFALLSQLTMGVIGGADGPVSLIGVG